MMKPLFGCLAMLIAFGHWSCTTPEKTQNVLQTVLASDNDTIAQVVEDVEKYELQVRYTSVRRQGDSVILRDESFMEDADNYFYPASTVKFPVALLALEKVTGNDSINSTSRFFVEGDTIETTIRKEVSKIFAVSDNEAYNRLYEFLGPDRINRRMETMNIGPARIAHRLSVEDADNPKTRPLLFYLNDSTLSEWPETLNQPASELELNKLLKGKGYYDGDSLIAQPMDFSKKNYLPVKSLHNLMKRVALPEMFPPNERFNLNTSDREFVLKSMSALPYTLGYDREEYYDSYVKFFLYGDRKSPIPEHIKIYNKVGYAYGYLTDCAYIKDTLNQVEFILTATIHVNEDGIYNDNVYEYETVGIPFLAALGREIYNNELQLHKER